MRTLAAVIIITILIHWTVRSDLIRSMDPTERGLTSISIAILFNAYLQPKSKEDSD